NVRARDRNRTRHAFELANAGCAHRALRSASFKAISTRCRSDPASHRHVTLTPHPLAAQLSGMRTPIVDWPCQSAAIANETLNGFCPAVYPNHRVNWLLTYRWSNSQQDLPVDQISIGRPGRQPK